MTLLSIFAVAFFAFQSPSLHPLTPEEACGPDYHEFSPPAPSPSHIPRTTLESLASSETLIEGTVVSKKTYAGFGVENDIQFRVTKPLKGAGITKGDVLTIHVNGGYAGDDRGGYVCRRDDQSDGMRVEVGRTYLVALDWDPEKGHYRAIGVASWFLIGKNGDLIALTPALIHNKTLAGKKISDLERSVAETR